VIDRHPETAANDPDNIQDRRKATGIIAGTVHLFSKGPEYHTRQLKALNTEWDTNDGAAKGDATYQITNGCEQAAEYEPDDITEKIKWHSRFF